MNNQEDMFCPACHALRQRLPFGRHPVIATPSGRVVVWLNSSGKAGAWLDLSPAEARELAGLLNWAVKATQMEAA